MNEPKRIEEVLALEEQVRRLTADVAFLTRRVVKPPRATREPWVRWVARLLPDKPVLFLAIKWLVALSTMLGFIALFVWFMVFWKPAPTPTCWTVERATNAHPWEPLLLWERGRWASVAAPNVSFQTADEGAAFMKKYNLKECPR